MAILKGYVKLLEGNVWYNSFGAAQPTATPFLEPSSVAESWWENIAVSIFQGATSYPAW